MDPLPGPGPLIVGVTGHRNICLAHEEKLRVAIANELRKLGEATLGCLLWSFSGLAKWRRPLLWQTRH